MYFTDNEMEVLCSNVAALLKEFGGCWITPDPGKLYRLLWIFECDVWRKSNGNYEDKSKCL